MSNLRTTLLRFVARGSSLVIYGPDYGPQVARHKTPVAIPSLLLVLLLAGCQSYRTVVPAAAAYYYRNPDKNLSAVGRVALVELDNYSSYPHISADVTEAIFEALQKKQLFGLTVVHQSDTAWRGLQLDLDSTHTLEQLLSISKTLKCNAVLTGTVTEFKPYPHMVIGLRLKLVDLADGQLLWALEQVWDAADKTTENRIKKFFQSQMRSGFAPLPEQLVTVSPLSFIKFATYEVAATL